LQGIGPYTSKAILIFAFDEPLAAIDTNIRRVLLHEFGLRASTPMTELEALAYRVLPKKRSRDWHNGLMDYSRIVLPKQLAAIPPVSRQSRFEGSVRQVRGEIIRQLLRHQPVDILGVAREMKRELKEVKRAAESMATEGIVRLKGGKIWLVD
jgi:A/G-specific adenine glycosylase